MKTTGENSVEKKTKMFTEPHSKNFMFYDEIIAEGMGHGCRGQESWLSSGPVSAMGTHKMFLMPNLLFSSV